MRLSKGFELTYCTNIHAAEGWQQVFEQLRHHGPELKRRISPQASFGIGLRLANAEAIELLTGRNLDDFSRFLQDAGLYVALLNGFPYGQFHERRLKDQVFAPDWYTEERVSYTLRLVKILHHLLPAGLDGGVSTCPLSYKPWAKAPAWDTLIRNIVRVAEVLFELDQRHGQDIHLDIEPEPDGTVETVQEFIVFFQHLLLIGAPILASSVKISRSQAEATLRKHIALCYDLCHSAVESEDSAAADEALRKEGIRIGRVQISSAMKAFIPQPGSLRGDLYHHLETLTDAVYLHQTIGDAERFTDLPEALKQLDGAKSSEWRIHYHVPLFLERYGELSSTQAEVRAALAHLDVSDVRHLEIETYTWGVLPQHLRLDIADSIEREYRWVMAQL